MIVPGFELPKDISDRFLADRGGLQEKYPKHFILSYQTRAMYVWDYLMNEMGFVAPPPPIVIDRRKHPPRVLTDAGKPKNWIIGVHNYSLVRDDMPDGQCEVAFLIDYEVRIFHENMLLELKTLFDGYMSSYILGAAVDHVLMHEMLHYIHHLEFFLKVRKRKPENRGPMIKKWVKSLREPEFQTEEINERRTLQYLKGYYVNQLVELPDPNMRVVMGGKYDWMLRKKYADYSGVSKYLEYEMLKFCDQFDTTIAELATIPAHEIQEQMDDLLFAIRNENKRRLKFILED